MTITAGTEAAGRMDLHTHSTASDGSLSPAALVAEGQRAGLEILALTDHDTVDGLGEFFQAGAGTGLTLLGGVEISLEHPKTFHLLGYNVRGGAGIPSALERLQGFRDERNRLMLKRLNGLGYAITWERLKELSPDGQLGRPHFATALLEKGYFTDRQAVFDELLKKGQPGYVDKIRLDPPDGLAMLRAAKWAPVLAHPVSLGLSADQWPAFMAELVDMGLVGVEVYHPDMNEQESRFFLELAARFKLAPTCGSDFHGANKATPLTWVQTHSPLGLAAIEQLRQTM